MKNITKKQKNKKRQNVSYMLHFDLDASFSYIIHHGVGIKIEDCKAEEALLKDWDWPYQRYSDGPEFSCPHGIGHSLGVHGCDGCCYKDNRKFTKANKYHRSFIGKKKD